MKSRTTVTSKGQITIPKRVRDKLCVEPGDKVDLYFDGDRAIIEPVTAPVPIEELVGALGAPSQKKVTQKEVVAASKKAAVRRYRKSLEN